jgi:hypothetical protein
MDSQQHDPEPVTSRVAAMLLANLAAELLARHRAVAIGSVNATVTKTFSGRSVAVVAPLGPAYGSLLICLDPGVSVAGCTTVTLHSTTAVERDIIYVSGPVAPGTHTVEITTESGSQFALDEFAVLG